ncbi:MAG: sulfurtransferase TusA family protein [Dehalococcoidia bacterium]|nr:sulfurtransferase TusA family protein [Dehalococcoidia bacterium]
MIEVDVRGLSCPIPVVRAQKAMATHPKEILYVMVDSSVAREHIENLAKKGVLRQR